MRDDELPTGPVRRRLRRALNDGFAIRDGFDLRRIDRIYRLAVGANTKGIGPHGEQRADGGHKVVWRDWRG